MANMEELTARQRAYFRSGVTGSIAFRKECLQKLRRAIRKYEGEILQALKKDLNKAEFEGYVTEISGVLQEIGFMLSHMDKLLKPRRVPTPLVHFPAVSRVYREPYGCVLIMAPWNYPFLLSMTPLVGAVACGNCAVVKPSNYAPATSAVIRKIVAAVFDSAHVAVMEGGREVNQNLLDQKFDLIFFTGSPTVGRVVMEKAAKHLTPVVLELGGKSPCIVDETANLKLAGELRHRGVAVALEVEEKSFKSQLRSANKSGARWAVIRGEDELNRQVAVIKDLADGTQTEVAAPDLGRRLEELSNGAGQC